MLRGRLPGTEKACAVKVLLGMARPNAILRFLREARTMARVRHPNLCEIYDSGEVDGMPWLALELVEGTDLHRLLKRNGPLPLTRIPEVVRQVGGALDVLHQARILHRDIKPANLMVDLRARLVLMDLGAPQLPVLIGRAQEISVGEEDRIDGVEVVVECGWAVDPHRALVRIDSICRVLEPQSGHAE